MVRKEFGIKRSIKAACINTNFNIFFHQVFLSLTLSLMKRILPWPTIVRWDIKSNLHEIIFRNANFRDYEFLFQKQQIGIIIPILPSKLFLMISNHLKVLIWTVGFFFLSIASDKPSNHLTGVFDKGMRPYDRQIMFQVYMIQLSG